jgi:uncharacterized membrane protein YesL
MWKYGAVGVIVATVLLLVSQALLYWIFFELSFNKHDKRDPLSVGMVMGTTAWTDKKKTALGITDIGYLVLKIVGFILFQSMYILWCFGDHWKL